MASFTGADGEIVASLAVEYGDAVRGLKTASGEVIRFGNHADLARKDLLDLMQAARRTDASLDDVAAAQKKVNEAFRAARTDAERKEYAALARELDHVEKELRQVERAQEAQNRTADRGTGFLGKLKGALGLVTAALSIGAVVAYVRRIYDLGTAAEETASKFTTVFGDAADEVDEFGARWANTAGLTRTEFRGIAADAGAITRGFGLSSDAAGEFSIDMVRLAGDLQSFHNVPIEETFAALRSGLTGESEPLKRFGILLTEAETKQRAAVIAAREHIDATSAQALALARLELITEKAGLAIGDLERTQDSTANTGRRLAAVWREAETALAQGFVAGLDDLRRSLGSYDNSEGFLTWVGSVGRNLGLVVTRTVETVRAFTLLTKALGLSRTETLSSINGISLLVFWLTAINRALLQNARNIAWVRLQWAKLRGAADDVRALTKEVHDLNSEIDRLTGWRLMAGISLPAWPGGGPAVDLTDINADLDELLATLGAPGGGGVTGATERAARATDAYTTYLQQQATTARELSRQAADLAANLERLKEGAEDNGQIRARVDAAEALLDAHGRLGGQIATLNDGAIQEQMAEAAALLRLTEAYADAAEAAADLAAWRREESDPALLANIRMQTAERERLAAAYERMVQAAVDFEAIRATGDRKWQTGPTAPVARSQDDLLFDPVKNRDELSRLMDAIDEATARFVGLKEAGEAAFNGITSSIETTAEAMGRVGNLLGQAFGNLASAAADAFEAGGRENKRLFTLYKVAAIAEATVATYVAATKAYASAPFPLNYALAAAVTAAGLANVARIRSQTVDGGGGSGSGSQGSGRTYASGVAASLPAGAAAAVGGRSSAPVVNVGGTTLTPTPITVEIHAGPRGLYSVVRQGAAEYRSTHGLPPTGRGG